MNDDLRDRLWALLDKAENYLAAASLPVPANIHAEGLKHGMEEIRAELSDIVGPEESRP